LTAFAKRVEGQLKENGFDPEITPIIYCGGGARIMEEFGSIKGIHICYMEDVRANAIGYEFITKQMFGSR
jgi:plasmid segregation protein ParM